MNGMRQPSDRYMRFLFLVLAVFVLGIGLAQEEPETADQTTKPPGREAVLLEIAGAIGPATRDYLTRAFEHAAERNAALIIIRMDTPGGLDASTRDIVKAILNSPVPVATFVAPEGARAASAGTYILYASHIAAMSPATNLGAATPVPITGSPPDSPPDSSGGKDSDGDDEPATDEPATDQEETGSDSKEIPLTDAMSRKVVNDAAAYIKGLAEKRGRNAEWAERAVREGHSIPSREALELGVIDLIAQDVGDLLEQIDGRVVDVLGQDVTLHTEGLVIQREEPDWRSELLAVITSPTVAYILLMIGLYGLIFEGYNPGAVLPGVVGAIALLLALYAFQALPVNYAGLALIVLGVILMIAEAFAPSFGALGIGGVIALVIGSIILIDTDVPGFGVSRPLIGAIGLASGVLLMAIIGFAVKARQRPVVAGREQLLGEKGEALMSFTHEGDVHVRGERWAAVTEAPVSKGQVIEVTRIDGLTLKVRPAEK
jgi:membrane-bound serine protease (ClpP class)